MRIRITYLDKNESFRTTYATDLKKIAGCVKFTAITPAGQKNGRLTISENRIKLIETLETK